jgi:hypothetical protein
MASGQADPKACKKAIKLLKEFERLANQRGSKLPQKRLDQLRRLRDAGTIRSTGLPATLAREFPGMTLDEIRATCEEKD